MTKLDDLENLANEASRYEWGTSSEWTTLTGSETEGMFIAAASPETIKAMITLIRQQHEALDKLKSECEAEFTTDGYWNMDGALVTRKTVKKAEKALAAYKVFVGDGASENKKQPVTYEAALAMGRKDFSTTECPEDCHTCPHYKECVYPIMD